MSWIWRKYNLISSLQSAGDGILVCRVGGGDQLLVDRIGDIGSISFDDGLYASCNADCTSEHGTLCSKQYEHGPVVSFGISHFRFRVLCLCVSRSAIGKWRANYDTCNSHMP